MRQHETDTPLSAEIERELAAIEAALAGQPVDPEFAETAALVHELREERPRMSQESAADLDALAGERFARPRRFRLPKLAAARRLPSRRVLVPALGTAATLSIVLAVAISQNDQLGGPSTKPSITAVEKAPTAAAATKGVRPSSRVTGAGGSDVLVEPPIAPPGQGIAPGHRNRLVQRDAELTLSTSPSKVHDVADQVIAVTQRYHGIVLTSSVNGGDAGQARGSFDLRIPAVRLEQALADLSRLAHVGALSENTQDITASDVRLRSAFRGLRHARNNTRHQLNAATNPLEIRNLRIQLRNVQKQLAEIGSQARSLERSTTLASVAVTIETGGGFGSGGSKLHNALHDALNVLSGVLAVLIVTLAVLVPLALLSLLAWLAYRRQVRRGRESALDA